MTSILDTDQQSWCRAAFSWSLGNNLPAMDRCLAELSPMGKAALLLAVDTLSSAIRLEPVSVPEGVEGHTIGQRVEVRA